MNERVDMPSLRERLEAMAVTSSCFLIIYNAANRIAAMRGDAGVAVFTWEHRIPFVPWMIFPYWSLDLFFVAAPFICRSREQLRNLVFQLCFAIFVAGIFFVAFPLKLLFERPALGGVMGFLFGALDNMKDFYNLAPSLHIAIRSILWALYIPLFRGIPRAALRLWFVLIGISTLLCWRHHVIDLFTGHLLALVTLHIFSQRISLTDVSVPSRQNANPRIAIYYFGGALLLVLLASLRVPSTLFLLWPASSLTIVGIAYFGFGPQFLGKSETGFAPWSLALLYPYLAGAKLSAFIQGRKLPAAGEITNRVRIGKLLNRRDAEEQLKNGVTAVLDLTAELPENEVFQSVKYRNIGILDLTAPSPNQLSEAVSFIEAAAEHGTVYIHCALGRSRSAVVAAAYLMASCGLDAEGSVQKVCAAHRHTVLKPEYLTALNEYGESL